MPIRKKQELTYNATIRRHPIETNRFIIQLNTQNTAFVTGFAKSRGRKRTNKYTTSSVPMQAKQFDNPSTARKWVNEHNRNAQWTIKITGNDI